MKHIWTSLIFCTFALAETASSTHEKALSRPVASGFMCSEASGAFRPYSTRPGSSGVPLGQGAMTTLAECQRAVANSKNGIICSRTGIDGWKPTHYSGHTTPRPDYGYINGSSFKSFDACLKTTLNSTKNGVCYFGDPRFYIGDIDGKGITIGAGSASLEGCLQMLNGAGVEIKVPNAK